MYQKYRKIGIRIIIVLSCVIAFGMLILLKRQNQGVMNDQIVNEQESTELTEVLWHYPKNLILDEPLTKNCFVDESGDEYPWSNFNGHYTVITYWASWCRYCEKQMQVYKEIVPKLESDEVKFLLIDKLDGEKETIEQAKEYLEKNEIPIQTLYDQDLKIYNELGIRIVPTTFVLNEEGKLVYCYAGVIQSEGQLQAIIEYARMGASYATEKFVTTSLMSMDGGIYTNYKERQGESPIGHDILSESQGLLMEYAAMTKNQELFERGFSFAKEHLYEQNLATWVVTSKGEKADANALLDDLRILRSLHDANNSIGGYEEEETQLAKAILLYNAEGHKVVDFYNFSTKEKASRFTLCYGDFIAMQQIEEKFPHMTSLEETMLAIVQDGYISDEFPFYHNYYDYNKKVYDEGALNMAEAMYTLYHLAEVGALKQTSVDWLKEKLRGNGILARYGVDGEVIPGYEYQSSAVYALVGFIATQIQDKELLTMAISRMEDNRCFDASDSLNGAFAKQLDDVMSYDQCLALVLYAKSKECFSK